VSRHACRCPIVAFVISTAFPVGACIVEDTATLPRVWGVLDVTVAAILAGLAITVATIAEPRVDAGVSETAYRVYRVLLHGLLVGVIVFLTVGDRINWSGCLVGFVWRAWCCSTRCRRGSWP